jgi:protein TonB
MKLGWILGIACAVLFHVCVLLFGGILFPRHDEKNATTQEVELLSDVDAAEKDEPKPEEPKPDEEPIQTEEERPPDATEVIRNLEQAPMDDAPALEAASLSAIEAALNGAGGGGGDFASALSFESGGRIGGTGKAGALEQGIEEAFNMTDIDQKPRAVFQVAPVYPTAMRGKKVEGVVTLIFVVDSDGKVVNPRVEKSSQNAFDDPALSAVKKWKFEPGLRGGQRVPCKMRVPIRFPAS